MKRDLIIEVCEIRWANYHKLIRETQADWDEDKDHNGELVMDFLSALPSYTTINWNIDFNSTEDWFAMNEDEQYDLICGVLADEFGWWPSGFILKTNHNA